MELTTSLSGWNSADAFFFKLYKHRKKMVCKKRLDEIGRGNTNL